MELEFPCVTWGGVVGYGETEDSVALDVSHNCWQGPYADFGEFREAVAAAAKEHYLYQPEYDAHPPRAFLGWWDNRFPQDTGGHRYIDALDVFFVHSDCEGWIFPQDAGALAARLEPLLDHLDDDQGPASPRQALVKFIAGLREASELDEVVEFR